MVQICRLCFRVYVLLHFSWLQALDGFMLLVSKDGKVLFTSESIAQYLGLRQVCSDWCIVWGLSYHVYTKGNKRFRCLTDNAGHKAIK